MSEIDDTERRIFEALKVLAAEAEEKQPETAVILLTVGAQLIAGNRRALRRIADHCALVSHEFLEEAEARRWEEKVQRN